MEILNESRSIVGSNNPATIIFLLDASSSMGESMPGGKCRITVAKEIVRDILTQLIQSTHGIIPEYRLAFISYSDSLYDLMQGVNSMDKLIGRLAPFESVEPLGSTNAAKAFEYVYHLLQTDLESWSREWLEKSPPPMIVNISDEEIYDNSDAMAQVRSIESIEVRGGNARFVNILITDAIHISRLYAKDTNIIINAIQQHHVVEYDRYDLLEKWEQNRREVEKIREEEMKIRREERELRSSEEERRIELEELKQKLESEMKKKRVVVLLDDINKMIVSKKYEVAKALLEQLAGTEMLVLHMQTDDIRKRLEVIQKVLSNAQENKKILSKILTAYQRFKISVALPRLLSKRMESPIVIQFSLHEMESEVKAKIESIVGKEFDIHAFDSKAQIGQAVKIRLYSPDIEFPEPKIKKLDLSTNAVTFLAKPKDTCLPDKHKVELSITDSENGVELQSETFNVKVVDFAFDHISRPLISRVSTALLGISSFAMFMLTFLEQIDKTVGLTSGTAAGVLAAVIYTNFYNLYQRIRPTTP